MKQRLACLALFTILGFAATAPAETLTPVYYPAVFDSSGKFLGHVLSYDAHSFYLLFKLSSGETVTLRVAQGNNTVYFSPTGLTWIIGALYYASSNCTGQAYVDNTLDAVERRAVVGPGNVLYVSGTGAQPPSVNSFYSQGACVEAPNQGLGAATWLPVNPTLNLDTAFKTPFTVANAPIQNVPATNTWFNLALAITLVAIGLFVSRFALKA